MSGVLPAALLCAALGFAMSAAAPRTQAATLTTLVVAASVGSFAPPSNLVTFACWLSVIATSLAVYLPPGLGRRLLVVLAANAGVWSGAAIGPDRVGLLAALPFALLCLPAAWLVARRRQI
ncbi:hypothetical protein, partial [Phenylobacterium sp.]|uniref:hypothetical protein n=1 Tax=Phenylobacterium sp. TaxID=1871053 RepID=UPI00286C334D